MKDSSLLFSNRNEIIQQSMNEDKKTPLEKVMLSPVPWLESSSDSLHSIGEIQVSLKPTIIILVRIWPA